MTNSLETSGSLVVSPLKAHKQFPRRNVSLDHGPRLRHTAPVNNLNKRIQSWIPDPSSYHAHVTLDAPPTPPPTLESGYKSWIDDDALKHQVYGRKAVIGPVLKKVQVPANSPPTPEVTPQKKRESVATMHTITTESRTDSFRTANEELDTQEEDLMLPEHGQHSYQKKWEQRSDGKHNAAVGLGLGLESEDEPTPTIKRTEEKAGDDEFISFDGVWGGATPTRIHDHFTERLRKAKVEETPLIDHEEPKSPVDMDIGLERVSDDGPVASIQNLETHISEPETSEIAGLSEAAQPSEADRPPEFTVDQLRAHAREIVAMEEKRLSQASTSSTVTAMVVENTETPVRRIQTLRRTGNFIDAREVSGSLNTSPSLRRQKRDAQKAPVDLRKSYANDALAPRFHSPKASATNGLVVLPDRRPSLHSSGSGSNRASKTFSVTSPPPSSRPTTAPDETPINYFNAPRPHRRSISVVIQQARPVKPDSKIVQEIMSPISSPVQPPPNTDLSRTTSVNSGGLRTHYVPPTPTKSPSSSPVDEANGGIQKPSIDGVSADARPVSDIVTPFSLRSTHSSTPGTLEVNEATALNIFPHTNRSILVIQELRGKDHRAEPTSSAAVIATNASIAMPGMLTPVLDNESPEIHVTDSPLLNPRDPPPPPDLIQIIPPTPANAHASSEVIIAAAEASKANRPNPPLSSIRRAFSARQAAESVKSKSSLRRTFSLKNPNPTRQVSVRRRYSFSSNDENEQHLYPTWRPRRFQHQDNDSDSDSDFGDGVYHPTSPLPLENPRRTISLTNRITNTLRRASLRRPRRSASISTPQSYQQPLPYEVVDDAIKRRQPLQRRLTNSLRLSSLRQPVLWSRRSSWSGGNTGLKGPRYVFQSQSPNGRSNDLGLATESKVPRQGFQVQYLGLRGVTDWLERRRELREEDKREKRREKLRGAIDVVGPEEPERL